MGFNQKSCATYFVSYMVNGTFDNTTLSNVSSPLSPNDIRNMEQTIRRKGDYDERVVILNFKRMY